MENLSVQIEKIEAVKVHKEIELLQLDNVNGVGIGYKKVGGKETEELCIQIFVEQKLPRAKVAKAMLVPAEIGGIKTDVVEIGKIEVQPTYTSKQRPCQPAYSIGHYNITAGTFGCLVRERDCWGEYILSNNHVLANSNEALKGDPILQPGSFDGGTLWGDVIARLHKYVPLHFNSWNSYNLVDAALAKPIDGSKIIAPIAGLETPNGTEEATLGMSVIKSGRTTGVTTGTVWSVNVTVTVVGYSGGWALFKNQILTGAMSAGGDSGSLLLSQSDHKAVGLLFAGSPWVTVHNNITNVLMALDIDPIIA